MSIEKQKAPLLLTTRAKRGLGLLAAGGLLAGGAYLAHEQQPEFRGEQTVVVGPGDTVDGLINEHVEGGASHTGEARVEVLDDPGNADVFENGQLDPGEVLELPKEVKN